MNFGPLFRSTNFRQRISDTFCRTVTKFGIVRGLANSHLFPVFHELWSEGPAIPCSNVHHSFTDAAVLSSVLFCITGTHATTGIHIYTHIRLNSHNS